jgi:hypothetical protein
MLKWILVLAVMACFAWRSETASAQVVAGPYLWGGFLAGSEDEKIARSIMFLLDEGFSAVRIAITPNSYDPTANCPEPKMLECSVTHALKPIAFDDQRLRFLMITLHDFSTERGGDFQPDTLKSNKTKIFEEYRAAFTAIAERFNHRDIAVVVSNWEGDNLLFCGSVYNFARVAAFAEECRDRTKDRFEERLESIFVWFAIREDALNAVKRKYSGLDIQNAIEFNNLHVFSEDCILTCDNQLRIVERLNSLGRRVLCSYSSYDSINRGSLDRDLGILSDTCKSIIIGEAGFRLQGDNLEAIRKRWEVVARAIIAHKEIVRAIFIWNAFEGNKAGFGLYRANGEPLLVRALPPSLAPR